MLGLAGCAGAPPAPRLVHVRLDGARAGGLTGSPASSLSLAPTSFTLGSAVEVKGDEARLDEAWKRAALVLTDRAEEELALQSREPLAAFRATRAADYASEVDARRAEQSLEAKAELSRFTLDQARLAESLGWERTHLAWRVGFPDPDPKSAREPVRGDVVALRHWPEAKEIRTRIAVTDAEFDRKWKQLFLVGRASRQGELDRMKLQRERELELEVSREAERLRAESGARDGQLRMKAMPASTPSPAIQEATVSLPGHTVSFPSVSETPGTKPADTTRARLGVFLAQNNYRLANPGETAPDVTKEFRDWLRKYEPGS